MEPRKKIFCPVRKKLVALTPEEGVRQFVINFLRNGCGIPAGYMSCEAPVKVFETKGRSDIWVHNRSLQPVMIVECKRAEVVLSDKVLEQAMKYALPGGERFVVITNGLDIKCFEREGEGGWRLWNRLPLWEELNGGTGSGKE